MGVGSDATVPDQTSHNALRKLQIGCAAVPREKGQEKMNKALLVIVVPALLVATFWLTLGWGWRTAALGAFAGIVTLVGIAVYLRKTPRTL